MRNRGADSSTAAALPASVSTSWAEKYRPKRLSEVLGNPQALEQLRAWAQSWHEGQPSRKAVLLHGPPGAGKTSAALAVALEFGWGVIELNASDVRSAAAIKRVAGAGAVHETFSDTGEFFSSTQGRRKLIVLDEADNLYERGGEEATVGEENFSDRGGRRAILETIAQSQQPIILIANDSHALTRGAGATMQKHVLAIPFRPVPPATLGKMLAQVASAEGVEFPPDLVRALAARAHGDARSALNDLQALAQGRRELAPGAAESLGERNRAETMFGALATIFKGEDGAAARRAVMDVDETPDFVLAWLDENVAREYRDPKDLAAAYEWLSRADVFLGRVQRRQAYGMWGTATDLMTLGVSSAKAAPYRTPPYYQFPGWIRKMGASKTQRSLDDSLASTVAVALHTGFRSSRQEMVPALRRLAGRDADFAEALSLRLGLDEDHIRHLLGPEASPEYADRIVERVEGRRGQAPTQQPVDEAPAAAPPGPEPPKPAPSRTLFDF